MPYGRRPRKNPSAPEESRPPPVSALMRDHFERKPYAGHLPGAVVGEFVVGNPEAAPKPRPPVVMPPPPWSEHYRPELDPDHEPAVEEPDEEDER
jgi:hypothetical protein